MRWRAWMIATGVMAGGVMIVADPMAVADEREPVHARSGSRSPSTSGASIERAPATLRHRLAHLREEVRSTREGALVIANGGYRAAFSARDGVVYTPRINGGYERRLRWQYRARAIRTDTVTRSLAPVAPTVSAAGDHIVDFVRPGLIERYEGERKGVEQIFVLSEKPAGDGDVRIAGDITFAGRARQTGAGVEFDGGDGLPPLTYANPVAFDAAGRSVAVRAVLDGVRLDLVLDDASLADAQYPVTVDPLFGVAVVEEAFTMWADVAYNARRGEFLVVYGAFGETPEDEPTYAIRARRYHDFGDPVGPPFTLTSALGPDNGLFLPAVAYDLHTDRYLAVWLAEVPGGAAVYGLVLDGISNPVGTAFALASWTGWTSNIALDVAARTLREHQPGDPSFLVTWVQPVASGGGAVFAERVTATGAPLGESVLSVGGIYPSVAFDPHTDRFLVVYSDDTNDGVRGRTLSAAGVYGSVVEISPDAGSFTDVAYDTASRKYLAVWSSSGALRGRFLASGAAPAPIGNSFVIGSPGDRFAVASDVGTFVVHLTTRSESTYAAGARRFRADGLLVDEVTFDTFDLNFDGAGVASGFHGFTLNTYQGIHFSDGIWAQRVGMAERWFARYVQGGSGDLDGDGRSDLFLFQQATDMLSARTQTASTWYVFAVPGAIPTILDRDGDGRADIGVWEPSTGRWWMRLSSNSQTINPLFGQAGDIPVPGDYRGVGSDQLAVFRPSTATWRISGAHQPAVSVQFGQLGDLPLPADWNGDGDIELGVWRPSTGVWYAAELDGTPVTIPATPWGGPGDIPLAGNFVGSARADQIVYRRQLGVIYRRDGATGATATIAVGTTGIPTPLDWDGDGRLEFAMFDAEAGQWRINDSSGSIVTFGTLGDIPAGAR
jgi:hypothetical protein